MPADHKWPDVNGLLVDFCAHLEMSEGVDFDKLGGSWELVVESFLSRYGSEASTVVPVPPCPTCEGEGWGFRRETVERERWSTERIDRVDCPSCNGTGHDRLIPESEIRAWIKGSRLSNVRDAFDGGYTMALGELQEWLDER